MADVIGLGHGGDGAGNDPPGGGGFDQHGHHEQDVVPIKKKRGKAKNIQLDKELKNLKRPLNVDFDMECTFHPVGKKCDYFTREVGIYIWRNIPLDREGWRNVEKHEQNALDEHLRGKFDLVQVEKDIHADKLKGGIAQTIARRFSDRKNKAKTEFKKAGGYADVEAARKKVPEDMQGPNWQKAIDHFLTPQHIKRSLTNAACRAQQKYNYRGGTSSYASTCFKEGLSRIESFYKAHTTNGIFDSPIAEKNYQALVAEYEASIQHMNEEEEEEEGGSPSQPSRPNDVAIFEKVMGQRRGCTRGIGPNPSSKTSPSVSGAGSQGPQFPKGYFKSFFQNPEFQRELQNYLASNPAQLENQDVDGEEAHDGNEDDVDMM